MERRRRRQRASRTRDAYIHTPPPWRRSSNACTAGKAKVFQSHRTGGVAILALGRRPRTRKAWSELISPISPAYPAALDSLLLRYLPGTASGVTTRSTPTESTRCFPIAWTVHGQLGRLPSANMAAPRALIHSPIRLHRLTNVITNQTGLVVRFVARFVVQINDPRPIHSQTRSWNRPQCCSPLGRRYLSLSSCRRCTVSGPASPSPDTRTPDVA